MRRALRISVVIALALVGLVLGSNRAFAELPLVLSEDFETGADRWEPTDPASWKIASTPKGNVYNLHTDSKYKPKHRSPVNIAIAKEPVVSDFVLDAELQSTVKDYDHRSLVLVFGYQDPDHFYYVHFGKKTDDHANQIFIVNAAPRVKISTKTTPGTPWDDAWHHVKIVRSVGDGKIDVYFDDLQTPVMTAVDKTFTSGRIGLGAFDDLGNFDHIVLHGAVVTPAKR